MPDITWVPYFHTIGPRACGALAFLVADIVTASAGIKGEALRRADGGMVGWADQVHCTTCGGLLRPPLPLPVGPEVEV